MFCNQCEQAKDCVGCTGSLGKCGKNEDIQSLQEIILYGLKGLAAYAHHARRLGMVDEEVDAFVEEALFSTLTNVNFSAESLLEIVLEVGQKNLRVMQMLDEGHVQRLGKPVPTTVKQGTHAGPGILVTGHDMVDLADLLDQLKGTNINVYTHGEMLPAHSYPNLKASPNLAGHYGTAWQNQKSEWSAFPGPILATTNCIMPPPASYAGRVFSTRVTAFPGMVGLRKNDFSPLIHKARECAPCRNEPAGESIIGFHHSVIMEKAGAIVDAVKAGKISRFFVIGGCDGAEVGRNYFSEYAQATPADSFILTLGCGKFRIRDYDYGTHLGLPGLMDMGQCNDAYGAVQVALALAGAFNCSVNDLPLTIVCSWFEQKAVAVLLTLLSLGVKGITIGPNPPAFVSPGVMDILQEKFDLRVTGDDPKGDVRLALMPVKA